MAKIYVDRRLAPVNINLRHEIFTSRGHRQDESFDTFLAHAGKGRGVELAHSTPRGAEHPGNAVRTQQSAQQDVRTHPCNAVNRNVSNFRPAAVYIYIYIYISIYLSIN